ncbi:MAG TPA: PfkB family carbohydrate kinase [Chloroflexota bacterium]|nr:PfkB family carbohydrate kinase [Chloroflexota bacterium]
MSITVVGSVALDTVETPFGKVENALGGAATYFSTAASLYTQVQLVGVVGDDFPEQHVEFLRGRGVDVRGLQRRPGQTFHWAGRYEYDNLNNAQTLDTQLGLFASFDPQLPDDYRSADCVFLANIDPALQLKVLEQVRQPKLAALDSMNFWITSNKPLLTEVMRKVDVVLMNEAEALEYGETFSLVAAARKILELGPKVLLAKKGEYGAALFARQTYFFAPAYPLEVVKDPTGAGDTFAGGFLGYLSRVGDYSLAAMKRAVLHGSAMASFTIEDYSIDRLRTLTLADIERRVEQFAHFTNPRGEAIFDTLSLRV